MRALQVIWKLGSVDDTPQHILNGSDVDDALATLSAVFVAFAQTVIASQPSEGALGDPTAREEGEALVLKLGLGTRVDYRLVNQIPRRGLASNSSAKDILVSHQKAVQSVGSFRALPESFRFKPGIQVAFKLAFFEH